VTVLESLRKNATLLLTGLGSAIVALLLMRQSSGEPLFQPQSDFGVLLGAFVVAAFVVFRDISESNGKPQS
jgi:hypothetical protein